MASSVPKRTPAQVRLEQLQLMRQQELERERHADATYLAITRRRLMLGEMGMDQFMNPNLPTAQRQGQRLESSLTEPATTAAEAEERRRALVGNFAVRFQSSIAELLPQRGGTIR